MRNFFVTGLPRSRTKWFSQYFTGLPGVFCWHEAMNGCRSLAAFDMRLKNLNADYVGDADSGLMFSGFQQRYMGCPTVIIERDIEAVYASLCGMFGEEVCESSNQMELLREQQAKLDGISGLRVPFEDIDSRIQEIHEYLVGVPFDPDYAEKLINTNIQVDNLTADVESAEFWRAGGF